MEISELLDACLNSDDESAWLTFIARFQPLIAAAVSRVCRRYRQQERALVDDLVQETYLRLCRGNCQVLRSFRERHEAAILGYLKVVATTVALDHFRARMTQKRREEVVDDHGEIPEIAVPSASIEQSAQIAEVDRCLAATESNRDRAIFWLYYRQGYTARDIAAIRCMGLTQKGVESCIYRLTQVIRGKMACVSQPVVKQEKGKPPQSAFGVMK
jgi:RNA polymerase sigma-70 factor, ECF subfamily